MSYFDRDPSRGISPVVGVILMVAITVVLSGVIAVFALNIGTFQSQPVTADVKVTETTERITATLLNDGTADKVIIRDHRGEYELASTGQSVNLERTGCQMDIIGVRDGEETLLETIHASVGQSEAGLISFWPSDECQVSDGGVIDATGQQEGTIEGDVTTGVAGVTGEAFKYTGDGHLLVGSRGEFQNMTVSTWVKPNGSDGWIAGNGAKWRIRDIPSSNKFEFWVREGNDPTQDSESVRVQVDEDIDGQWWHVVGVYELETQEVRIYVNGTEYTATSSAGFDMGASGHENMVIGNAYEGSSEYNTAVIDELRIYNRVTGDAFIQDLCEQDAPAGHPCA